MQSASHWENIYSTKAIHDVSWFQKHARCSLDLIGRTQISPDARIIDVGSGASILISELIALGYKNLTVLDISSAAIAAAQKQLGSAASGVQWIHCDVTKVKLSNNSYDLWHDRAAISARKHGPQTWTANMPLHTGRKHARTHGPQTCPQTFYTKVQ